MKGIYGASLRRRDFARARVINQDVYCGLFENYVETIAECDEDGAEELTKEMFRQQEIGARIGWRLNANNGNGGNA